MIHTGYIPEASWQLFEKDEAPIRPNNTLNRKTSNPSIQTPTILPGSRPLLSPHPNLPPKPRQIHPLPNPTPRARRLLSLLATPIGKARRNDLAPPPGAPPVVADYNLTRCELVPGGRAVMSFPGSRYLLPLETFECPDLWIIQSDSRPPVPKNPPPQGQRVFPSGYRRAHQQVPGHEPPIGWHPPI
jgi:hypothetical protein